MQKEIEQLTDEDLQELWPAIGGEPHLFEYGKDELKQVLTTGFYENDDNEPIGIQLDYYTMAVIVDTLRNRGFNTCPAAAVSAPVEEPAPLPKKPAVEEQK